MVNKNEVHEIIIEDIGTEGQGIGHVDGEAVFVKDTLPGDTATVKIIKAKKNMAYGRLEEIIKPSVNRVVPRCEVAKSCGGCTLQHMDYNAQLSYKWNKVRELLKRVGGISEPERIMEFVTPDGEEHFPQECTGEEDVHHSPDDSVASDADVRRPQVDPGDTWEKDKIPEEYAGPEKLAYGLEEPYHYRNKMQFPVGLDKNGKAVLGFYAGRTHSIIPLTDCCIGHEVNRAVIKSVKEHIDKYKVSVYDEEKHSGLIRHVLTRVGFHTNELMVCLVINGDELPYADKLYDILTGNIEKYNKNSGGTDIDFRSFMININKEKTNRILGFSSKVLRGEAYITDYIGDIVFRISPESFFQVNPEMTGKLYGKALEYAALKGGEKVWDMYCGIGTISLFLSQKAGRVYGVEVIPQAIEDAGNNAKLNGIDNTEFFVGKAEEVVPKLYAEDRVKYSADVVVVDPPRKGCDEKLLDTIREMAPDRIVYVSCDPATLARDIRYLTEHGYQLKKVAVYDQFSHGVHVESCVLLERVSNRKADSYVKLNVKMEDYYRIKDTEKKTDE